MTHPTRLKTKKLTIKMSDSSNTNHAPLLSTIHTPDDLKKIDSADLPKLAQEIRDTLIQSLSETGGHLGPNLGVVELTIAMHRVFSSPVDKFLFDVSHQGYVHKLLTGRADKIGTIRQYEGLNGFLLRTESEYDCYGAGHAGTALSAALGMASARDLKGADNHVVCVSGDAAFTCGPTLEALNNAAEATERIIIVLNDNEWSIDKNVGAIAKYFNALQTHPTYNGIREKAADFVGRIAGDSVRRLAHKIERNAKNLIIPNVLFEKFGIHYYGPIDGHDIPLLVKTFEHLKKQNEPVILHIITEKGRGYQPALEKPGKFHGLGPYKVEDGSVKAGAPTYSELFGRAVTDFAKVDKKITAITAAMPGGTKLDIFKNEIPERYFDVGIAEEHAALFACGQAAEGMRPFLAIYSTFMQRAFDMIVHDIALQKLPVRLCMDRGGLSGDDGPTHHGLFDIGYLRHIPGIIHMQPKDEDEFIDMLWTMANYDDGPIAIRYPRGGGMGVTPKETPVILEIGKGEVLADGNQIALIPLGSSTFDIALEAKEVLEKKGYSVALLNPRFIKPLDREMIIDYARKCQVVCTMEDHVLANGFGASVIELLHDEKIDTPVARIGWPDEFVEHGKPDILRVKHGLTAAAAVEKILSHLS